MTYPHGTLTPDQISRTFFVVPTLGIEFLFGPDGFAAFAARRQLIRDNGSDLVLIGWPDGTTVEYSRPKPQRDCDVADLAKFYHQFHTVRAEREAQGETK